MSDRQNMQMSFGSLFAGIGGLDLGLERAGMQCAWQVETDPYCIQILEKHWPAVKRYGDIKTIKWEEIERIDLICGGFPCQPFSVAGKRKGVTDDRNLWPEMLRAIRGLRPRFVLGENVPGIGDYLDTICADLEAEAYEVLPLEIPAAAFGAPHLRYRIFIVAHAKSNGWQWPGKAWGWRSGFADGCSANANSESLGRIAESRQEYGQWDIEPDMGRVADGVSHRVDRLRCLGNAVVPQIAEWLGQRILETDTAQWILE